jgi:hypothetical protein
MNDPITAALGHLAPHLVTIDPLVARAILEDLYDAGQDDLLADLISTAECAALWGVTRQRAAAHIAHLHGKYGYGRLVGSVWVIRRAHAVSGAPDARYRRHSAETTDD